MLNPDFRDILSSLNAAGVEFIVVGAYALSGHGFSRATGDIDIFLRATAENASKTMIALREFGAPLSDLADGDLTSDDMVIQLGVEPSRIDLLTKISGVSFDDAWANKELISVDGIEFFILSKSDLLTNKRMTDRPKDKGDIAWLEDQLS